MELQKRKFPKFPGWWKALGPGIVWMALAQGSGELIWWPYIVAKYGLGFLFLLIPACLLQYPLNYQIGSYTMLTGESIFRGFIRLNRVFAFLLWILMTVSFLWFGAFASAGGTSLAALTHFPAGWSDRGQTLFWAYLSMAIFLFGILVSKAVYSLIEKMMWFVSIVTLVGLICACSHPEVRASLGHFLKGLVIPQWPLPRPWDPADATKLLTAITFAGLGGFWTLFYSYWLKEKKAGMAFYSSDSPASGFTFDADKENLTEIKTWKRFLCVDSSVGIFGNILTTLMTCLLAYALLFPKGILPDQYEIAVVQAKFFEVSWGVMGRLIFLFVAACFLSDTWITTLDAISRIHTDFLKAFFPRLERIDPKKFYYFFILLFTVITSVTMLIDQPGPLILTSAVIGFVGTVSFSFAILLLNHRVLAQMIPRQALPGKAAFYGLLFSAVMYLLLAILYFGNMFFGWGK